MALSKETRVIQTRKGEEILVDADRYGELSKLSWYLNDRGYAVHSRRANGRYEKVSMARLIMGAKPGQWVDHRNGIPTDNRAENLRFCTPAQNAHNSRCRKTSQSGLRGVYHDKRYNKYAASITIGTNRIFLGNYDTAEAAAAAYERAALEHHGEFARTEGYGTK